MGKPFYAQGIYSVELEGGQGWTETKNGNAEFWLKFRPNFIQRGADWEPVPAEYERTWRKVLTPKTEDYFAQDLRTLGFAGENFSQLDPRSPRAIILTGQAQMICAHEEYVDNGGQTQTVERWQVRRQSVGVTPEAMPAAAVKKLDMLFGRALKALPVTAPVPNPTPLLVSDDDLPF